jgi:transposase
MAHQDIIADFLRYRAVELMKNGEPKELISRILGVSRNSLNKWWDRHLNGESLERKPHPGRRRRLTNQQLGELAELLSKGSLAHGWENNLWTSLRVRELIKAHFGVDFCRSQVWHILTDYLGWTARRPVLQDKKRSEPAIDRWKRVVFPRLDRDAIKRGASLVFVDETGFRMTSVVRRTFAAPGTTPVNRVSDPHGRISVIGAICVPADRRYLTWHHYMLDDNINFRGPSIVDFLKRLVATVPGPFTIVWDSIIIHWSNVAAEYLSQVPHVKSELFPPYAPELNPVDRAWFYIKYDRLPNFCPANLGVLRPTLKRELQRLQRSQRLLRSFIRYSDLPLVV